MTYENRVVVYIDILGFKELIDSTINNVEIVNEQKIQYVHDTLEVIRNILRIDKREQHQSIRITQFSDLVVISFLEDETSGVYYTITDIKFLLVELALRGIFCRGGIAYGKLIHTEKIVFGPALINAYLMESKIAHYPRIVLDDTILKIAGLNHAYHHTPEMEIDYIEKGLGRDSDGFYYVDYFLSIISEFNDPETDIFAYFQKLYTLISDGLNANKPTIRAKYFWLREKYNISINKIHSKNFLDGLTDDLDIRADYLSMKAID